MIVCCLPILNIFYILFWLLLFYFDHLAPSFLPWSFVVSLCCFLSCVILLSAILSFSYFSVRSLLQSQLFLVLRCWDDKQHRQNFPAHILLCFIDDTLSLVAVYRKFVSRDGTFNRSSRALHTQSSSNLTSKISMMWFLLVSNESQAFILYWGHNSSLKSSGLFLLPF